MPPNLFWEASVILIPKPDNDNTGKPQTNISCELGSKNSTKYSIHQNSTMYKVIIRNGHVGFILGMQGRFNTEK